MIQHHNSSPVRPKRVVILGASGFVARNLSRSLREAQIEQLTIGSAQLDLCQPESAEGLKSMLQPDDALVVTSAITPDKGKDIRTFMRNASMVATVSTALESTTCEHVIYLSSDAVYDDAASLVHEGTPRSPGTLYGLMHAAREQMLQVTAANRKIPLVVVRPCAIYGSDDTHNAYGPNRFLRTALKDRRIQLFGNGEEIRDHIFIRDVSRFLLECLLWKVEGPINITTGCGVSFRELAELVVRLVGGDVQIQPQARSTPVTHRHFDVSNRLKAFPHFHTTPLHEGLAQAYNDLISAAQSGRP